MAWVAQPGQTLLVPSGPAKHLFVVIFGPQMVDGYGKSEQIAMASATSIRAGVPHDPACELQPADHPFIRHPSYIAYRHLRLDAVAHAQEMVSRGVWTAQEPFAPAVLRRIVNGVCASRLTAREFKTLFGC